MRFRSEGELGLWSWVARRTLPSFVPIIARESPQLAIAIWRGCEGLDEDGPDIAAVTAVQPCMLYFVMAQSWGEKFWAVGSRRRGGASWRRSAVRSCPGRRLSPSPPRVHGKEINYFKRSNLTFATTLLGGRACLAFCSCSGM